ncbi:hypothetical protein ABZ820_18235 [Streptomyces diacarni]|uniref:hypothetical protein n=1 Tax=Streptomyces diacarni TaxID=2800381 RepID=UPI0033CE642B
MKSGRKLGAAAAVGTLMAGLTLGVTSSATAAQDDLSEVRATVSAVMGDRVEGRRINATTLDYDGFTARKAVSGQALNCEYEHLCMEVRGTEFSFYTCGKWNVTNWWGSGPYINNQTSGTVARFYGKNGNQLWKSTAYDSGTADWAPVWSLSPC